MNWLKKGMKIVCNENNLSGDIGKEYEVYMISNESQSLNKRVIKVIGRGSFKVDEIDWEKTAELNGIDLDKQKYIESLMRNGYSEEQIKNKVNEVFGTEIGYKKNEGKIRFNLLPISELKEVIKVFEYGCVKYSKDNWKHVKDPINEYSNALSRHLLDYLEGENKASDSNLPHLAHICANALILMWFENNKIKFEDDEYLEYCKIVAESHGGLE